MGAVDYNGHFSGGGVEGRGCLKFLPLLLSQMKTMLAYKSWNTKQKKSMPDDSSNRRR